MVEGARCGLAQADRASVDELSPAPAVLQPVNPLPRRLGTVTVPDAVDWLPEESETTTSM